MEDYSRLANKAGTIRPEIELGDILSPKWL